MTVALRAAAVSLVALSLAACGGGGGNADEKAIEDMGKQFLQAFADGDAAALAVLFGEECGDMTADASTAIEQYESLGEVEVDLDGVRIQNLNDTSAEFLLEGTVTSDDERSPLSGQDEDFALAVKENGVWKIAECDLLL